MEEIKEPDYKTVLQNLRDRLKSKRGYGSRVFKKLKEVNPELEITDIYNVAWGRKKDPHVLEALIEDATTYKDPSKELLSFYAKKVA